MMIPILILLFAMPDIKRVPIDNEMTKGFFVTEMVDETTADCSENPSGAGVMNQPLEVDLIEPQMPENTGIIPHFQTPSTHDDTPIIVTPGVASLRPKPEPDPDPTLEPPLVVTPEPPVALALLTAAIMFFVLFGRHPYRKPR